MKLRRTWLYPMAIAVCGVGIWLAGLAGLLATVALAWWAGRDVERLRQDAVRDPLTGLANRRELLARLRAETLRAARYGTHLTLLLIDVDGLKTINDRGGHAAGDRVLIRIAEAIRSACRDSDLAGRFGGDEFAIVVPLTRAAAGQVLAERVQQILRAARESEATISIGVCDLERVGRPNAEELWATADRALYAAKSHGRDRVALAPHLQPAPPSLIRRPILRGSGSASA